MSYYPPQPSYQTPGGYGPNPPTSQLTAVGISLIVAAALNLLFSFGHMAVQIFGLTKGAHVQAPAGEAEAVGYYFGLYGSIIIDALGIIVSPLIAVGAISLLRRRGLMVARTACVLACIPLFGCCCLLQIPFGIWGLVLLARQDVKNLFA